MSMGYQNSHSDIPNEDLDVFVGRILDITPESGERMVLCSLRAQGIKVQRQRVREAIGRVDPISPQLIKLPTPNALWYVTRLQYIVCVTIPNHHPHGHLKHLLFEFTTD